MSARRFWKPLFASLRSVSKSIFLQDKTVYNPVAQLFTILLLTREAGPYVRIALRTIRLVANKGDFPRYIYIRQRNLPYLL